MAKNNNSDNITQYPNSIDTRVALLEMSIANINQTLVRIESEIKELKSEGRSHHRWTIGLIAGLYLTFIATLSGLLIKFIALSH